MVVRSLFSTRAICRGRLVTAWCGTIAITLAIGGIATGQERGDRITQSAAQIQESESFGQPYERGMDRQDYARGHVGYDDPYQTQRPPAPQQPYQDRTYTGQQATYETQQDWQYGRGEMRDEPGGLGVALRETGGRGVQVIDVYRGSPAEQAGLRPGDHIVAINGRRVASVRELQSRIAQRSPGEQVEVVAFRDGQERVFGARLESRREALSQYDRTGRQPWTQDGQVQARLASLERQLQQLLSEVRTLRTQITGDAPQMPRQAQRPEADFQQRQAPTQTWDDDRRFETDQYGQQGGRDF